MPSKRPTLPTDPLHASPTTPMTSSATLQTSPSQPLGIPGSGQPQHPTRRSLSDTSGKKRPLTPSTPDHGLLRMATLSSSTLPRHEEQSENDGAEIAKPPSHLYASYSSTHLALSEGKEEDSGELMLVSAYITNALAQYAQGQPRQYEELVQQIASTTTAALSSQDAQTKSIRWIRALGQAVSSLSRDCHALVDAILTMNWPSQSIPWFSHYLRFLRLLVSAHAFYVTPVIRMLTRHFLMPETSPRAHQALRSILPLIPTASSGPLIFALTEGFPHKRESRKVQTTYLRNVLWCITYAPGIRDQMLHVAVERILQVDVEIQVGVEEMEEMEEGEGEEGRGGEEEEEDDSTDGEPEADLGLFPFEMEGEDPSRCDATAAVTKDPSPLSHLDSESDGDEESDEDDEDETEAQRLRMGEKRDTLQKIRGLTLKLDALLMLIFEFFQEERKRISGTSSTPSDIETDQFTLILEIFDRLILRTFKSRYTQFLLFWAASAQPAEFPDIFLGHLISLVTGPIGGADAGSSRSRFSPDVTRIAAASYVGSFVARAKFMPGDGVRNVTGILLAWASQYVEQCERQSSIAIGPDQAKHAVFYAVIQAVMYIFCFRWRELRIEALEEKDEEDGEEEPKEPVGVLSSWYPVISPLPRVIMSRLNPLKMCSKPVVQQFAHLSRSTHLMYCYTIIERNKSIYIPRSSSSTPGGGGSRDQALGGDEGSRHRELYSFFPFDPCQLPKTGRWVKDLYNEWEADDDDDDSDDDDGDEEEEDEDEGDFLGPDDDEEGIRGGVGAMSLSPASDSFLVSGIRRSKGTQ